MAKLSQAEWAGLWIASGGDPRKAKLASAVVMAESGGDTRVYNGICCYGGYQFNTNTLSKSCALSPTCATKAAIRISDNGRNWSKWETYTDGSYREYMNSQFELPDLPELPRLAGMSDDSELALFNIGPDIPTKPDPLRDILEDVGPLKPLYAIADFFEGLGELILTPEGWKRIGKILGGVILLLWGINTLMKQTTGRSPTDAAKGAATAVATKKAA